MAKPNIRVNKGVSEFNTALIELSISVSAIAKRNAGKKLPKNEVMAINFHCPNGIPGSVRNPMTSKKMAAQIIRNDPSWYGLSPTSPFLISIKELPQIKASIIRKNHFSCLGFMCKL